MEQGPYYQCNRCYVHLQDQPACVAHLRIVHGVRSTKDQIRNHFQWVYVVNYSLGDGSPELELALPTDYLTKGTVINSIMKRS